MTDVNGTEIRRIPRTALDLDVDLDFDLDLDHYAGGDDNLL